GFFLPKKAFVSNRNHSVLFGFSPSYLGGKMGGTAKIWVRNPAAALMYNSQSINWEMLKGYYVTGLPMDLIHAAATVIFIMLAAEPMLEKLDRIKVKYGLVE
ncbi:MAG: ECF transporter S component, partial [Oscillospiraceae bacterium]|nr:ECF transporter S component [Oscillospiraceae bacterium]